MNWEKIKRRLGLIVAWLAFLGGGVWFLLDISPEQAFFHQAGIYVSLFGAGFCVVLFSEWERRIRQEEREAGYREGYDAGKHAVLAEKRRDAPEEVHTRKVEKEDLWVAMRGFRMHSMTRDELLALADEHDAGDLYASKVIVEAARQVAALMPASGANVSRT